MKKGCEEMLINFYNPFTKFFLLVFWGTNHLNCVNLAAAAGLDSLEDHAISLSSYNTRILSKKSFILNEEKSSPLCISMKVFEYDYDSLESLDQQLKRLLDPKKREQLFLNTTYLLELRLEPKLLQTTNKIIFENTIVELEFSIKI